ncbi:hypothetical protein E7T06_15800 [Deinococcus sp. Arct2-2]|uniref:hypothetical protein n=1 Tax=Deinococcus sp. Arct2-2 TaxID=2568653 RepID=UPI0010A2D359|nr:hypothetical protein [Deinococcus sp. Arct2-2]THF68564.1 hypothetical protein E7T06_15800 [Deinococcus sp. Arct2-2]
MRRPPATLLPRCLLPALMCAALLSACGTAAPQDMDGASVGGVIVFPPAAGTAVFSAYFDGQAQAIASAKVASDGTYRLALPATPRLPSGSNLEALPTVPSVLPDQVRGVQCSGEPVSSTPNARVLVLGGGTFSADGAGGAVTGQLSPASAAISNRLTSQDILITTRTYAYADRDVRLTGTLNCTFTRTDSSTVGGSVQVNYDLKRGWNTLEIRTGQPSLDAPIATVTSSQTLANVNWRYLPVTP